MPTAIVSTPARLAFAISLLASAASAGGVRIASPAGGPSYATLKDAVVAASDGDLLLVGEGTYPGPFVVIQGKSLTVVAVNGDPQATQLGHSLTVRDLPAGGQVFVQGLKISGLDLIDCQGSVRFVDCEIVGPSAGFTFSCIGMPGEAGVSAQGGELVSFTRCRIQGGNGEDVYGSGCWEPPKTGAGGCALVVSEGAIALYDCVLVGGHAGKAFGTVSGNLAGDGLYALSVGAPPPSVFASGCQFQGGDGSTSSSKGGYAVRVQSGSFTYLDGSFTSGSTPPLDGPILGDSTALAGASRSWSAATFVSAGVPFPALLEGEPGDSLWVLRSYAWHQAFAPALSGVLHVTWPQHLPLAPLGVVPAGGQLLTALPGVRVPTGQVSSLLATQGLVHPAPGGALLSAPHFVLGLSPDVGPDCDANGVSDYVDVLLGGAPDANHNLIPDSCPGG